jgi:methylglyoxal synthase
VKALTRLAGVENIVFCCNRSTADHIISSPLFVDPTYERTIPDYTGYTKRFENKPVVAEAVESAKKRKKKIRSDNFTPEYEFPYGGKFTHSKKQ